MELQQRKLEILDPNNNNVLVQTWTSIENIYIVIDFKPNTNDPLDPDKNKDKIEYKDLETIGWYGVYAMDLMDVETQLLKLMGSNQADNIILISHGGANSSGTIGFMTDNNYGKILTSDDLEEAIKDKNKLFNTDTSAFLNIQHLKFIVSKVKYGGNFVLGSCNSGLNRNFLGKLQRLTSSRVNMYGICWTSTMPTIFKRDKDWNIIQGVGVVTADNLLSHSIIMPPDAGETDNGGAELFPVGWKDGDYSTHISDIRVGNCGIVVAP